MMFAFVCLILLLSTVLIDCIQIPFIRNVTLVPRYKWNSTTIHNRTTEECLCLSMPSFIAFNWFPNNTCQMFYTFPITYKIQSTPGTRLYFPQRIFPNVSQCCMPDLPYLLNKLKNGTWTSVNIPKPRNLLLDKHGYLVTVEMRPAKLDRFNPLTLTLINQTSIAPGSLMTVGYTNNAYFAGLQNGPIIVLDSENLTVLNRIYSTYIRDIRSIIFLDNGRTMVITCTTNNSIAFLHQTGNTSLNYTFAYSKSVNYSGPYGLTFYNDSFFYATSLTSRSVYSYSAVSNSNSWIESLFIDVSMTTSGVGTFMTIDECGRYWFSLETPVVKIFDDSGGWIGDFNLGNGTIMDVLIADNYVMYFSDRSGNQIIRIDPHIQC